MAEPPKKRVSLPVVGQRPLDRVDAGDVGDGRGLPNEGRSPLSWALLGVMAIFVVLVPLAMVAVAIVRPAPDKSVLPLVVAAVLTIGSSSFAGGYLVGRFGGRAGPREGALAGMLAGLVMWALTRLLAGVVVEVVTIPTAWMGARVGRASRKPGDEVA